MRHTIFQFIILTALAFTVMAQGGSQMNNPDFYDLYVKEVGIRPIGNLNTLPVGKSIAGIVINPAVLGKDIESNTEFLKKIKNGSKVTITRETESRFIFTFPDSGTKWKGYTDSDKRGWMTRPK
jgi:hypothetical protein